MIYARLLYLSHNYGDPRISTNIRKKWSVQSQQSKYNLPEPGEPKRQSSRKEGLVSEKTPIVCLAINFQSL